MIYTVRQKTLIKEPLPITEEWAAEHEGWVLRALAKWKEVLGLREWHIVVHCERGDGPDGAVYQTLGKIHSDWRYLRATLYWYMGTAKASCAEDWEEHIVHELLHVLLDELPNDDSTDYRAHEDRVVTQLARVLAHLPERLRGGDG